MSIFWTIVLLFFWSAVFIATGLIVFLAVEYLND